MSEALHPYDIIIKPSQKYLHMKYKEGLTKNMNMDFFIEEPKYLQAIEIMKKKNHSSKEIVKEFSGALE